LSDVAYNFGKESKYTRYSEQQSTNNLSKHDSLNIHNINNNNNNNNNSTKL